MSTIETVTTLPVGATTYSAVTDTQYYIYDENGNYLGFDYARYVADQQAENINQEEEIPAIKKEQRDEFIKKSEEKKTADIETIQSTYASSKIDKQYKEAALKYVALLNKANSEEEAKIVQEWSAIREQANKLTSVTASNTTVLEGIKEFISSLTSLENTTKHFKTQKDENDKKDTIISMKNARDIRDEKNKIKVYESNFFKSAVNVYDTEDDAIAVNE